MSGSGQVRSGLLLGRLGSSLRPLARNPRPAAIGTPIPGPGRIGKRGFPVSRFPPNRESGIPRFPTRILAESGIGDSLPDSRPNRESGERELGISACGPRFQLATSHWQPPLTCAGGPAGNPHFRGSKATFGPPADRVWYSLAHGMSLTWDEYPRFPDRPNRESGIPRFPDSDSRF